MFRISIQPKSTTTTVTLDGDLNDQDTAEVHLVLSEIAGDTTLDLRGLETCSEMAAGELRSWIDKGATIKGANPYIRMLLIHEKKH